VVSVIVPCLGLSGLRSLRGAWPLVAGEFIGGRSISASLDCSRKVSTTKSGISASKGQRVGLEFKPCGRGDGEISDRAGEYWADQGGAG
jgi:hypothetical protein